MYGISSFFKSSLTNNLDTELCSLEKQWKDYQNLKARPLKMTRYKKFVKLPSTTHFAPHSGNLQVSDMIRVRLENLLLKLLALREDPFRNVLPPYGHFFRTLRQRPYGGNTFQKGSSLSQSHTLVLKTLLMWPWQLMVSPLHKDLFGQIF